MTSVAPPKASSNKKPVALASEIDVVIVSNSSLDFLESWRPFLQNYHLIIVQNGDPARKLTVPAGFDAELFTREDITSVLKDKAWCISGLQCGARSFGILMAKKKYVWTLDDSCLPAKLPSSGLEINALQQHVDNLTSSSTPLFFNTLYDPYRAGADFVRGYPFSMREGLPTAVSHGLWLNVPDYDAPTRLVKPRERNTRYVDAVLTVPKGALYPMSGTNLAFNRELIGAAMYFGLAGEAAAGGMPDDMWAAWCSKVVADHLGLGCKTGLPYVWNEQPNTALETMQKDGSKVFSQEAVLPFFGNVKLSTSSTTAEACYVELAAKVRTELGPVDPCFGRLADGMLAWVECWRQQQA